MCDPVVTGQTNQQTKKGYPETFSNCVQQLTILIEMIRKYCV